jgi:hypothetical protein
MLQDAPDNLSKAVRGILDDELHFRPAPTRWSVQEIVGHMGDVEIAAAWRYRQMLEHEGCQLASFDQDQLGRVGKYESRELHEGLSLFRVLRAANLHVLLNLTATQWEKHGLHAEHGKLTVRELAQYMAGHDINHMLQIARLQHSQ